MIKITTTENEGKLFLLDPSGLLSAVRKGGRYVYTLRADYDTAYGFGEKFNGSNQAGRKVTAKVEEKCFYQGEYQYLTMPFFMTAQGFGVYVETYLPVEFDFTQKGVISFSFERGSRGEIADIYYFKGTLKEIIKQFKDVTAPTKIFPKWVLGAWMSSNRWRYQREAEEQLRFTVEKDFPHNVCVIEPWSDLSTHYYWGGSLVPPKKGNEYASYSEMDFSKSEYWQNPKEMIQKFHDNNIKVLLWVVPIFAKGAAIETTHNLEQRFADNDYIVKHNHAALMPDGKPYEIPKVWMVGSMVPDFTNKEGIKNWLNHFQHLLDIGVDGFKTDGGEFIHLPEVMFSDGTTGREGQNKFCESYIEAFCDFIGKDRVLFSRAGGPLTPSHSLSWAGDQESTWDEFASCIKAGISAGLSGISNWGFDIAGFSGYLPSKGLYARAVQAAAFVPIMQWHSDPVANNRCDFTGAWKINDRSPWNIADYHKDPEYLNMLKKHFNLHYNLIPYQYNLMLEAAETGVPAIRHLAYEFPSDNKVKNTDDQFMLGSSLMVAPVLEDYAPSRRVYLPQGVWYDLYTGKEFAGGREYEIKLADDNIPVFLRSGGCVALNLNGQKLFSPVGNDLTKYNELTFMVCGEGTYAFKDDLGNDIVLSWTKNKYEVIKNAKNTKIFIIRAEAAK